VYILVNYILFQNELGCVLHYLWLWCGARGGVVIGGTALQAGMSRIRFSVGSLEFLIDLILPVALWPWG